MIIYFALAVFGIIAYCSFAFNLLVKHENICKNAWSHIDIHIRLRNDLALQLESIAKGHAKYEKSLIEKIAKLRGEYGSSKSISKKAGLFESMNDSISKAIAISENYPELKANKSFLKLQEGLSSLESGIAFKRMFYNDSVFKYNVLVLGFPSNIVAKIFKFKLKESFNI